MSYGIGDSKWQSKRRTILTRKPFPKLHYRYRKLKQQFKNPNFKNQIASAPTNPAAKAGTDAKRASAPAQEINPSCTQRKADAPETNIALGSPERDLPTWNIIYIKPLGGDSHGGCCISGALDFEPGSGVIGLSWPGLSVEICNNDVLLGERSLLLLGFISSFFTLVSSDTKTLNRSHRKRPIVYLCHRVHVRDRCHTQIFPGELHHVWFGFANRYHDSRSLPTHIKQASASTPARVLLYIASFPEGEDHLWRAQRIYEAMKIVFQVTQAFSKGVVQKLVIEYL